MSRHVLTAANSGFQLSFRLGRERCSGGGLGIGLALESACARTLQWRVQVLGGTGLDKGEVRAMARTICFKVMYMEARVNARSEGIGESEGESEGLGARLGSE